MSDYITLGNHSYCTNPIVMWDISIKVGNYSSIAQPCIFIGSGGTHPSVIDRNLVANYPFNDVPCGTDYGIDYPKCGGEKLVVIGNDVWIGCGVTIKGGVTIGDGAIIGMHTVVTKDVPPYAVVVGSPCQIKKFRFDPDIIYKLLTIKWWNWDHDLIIERIEDFKDVYKFVEKYYKI